MLDEAAKAADRLPNLHWLEQSRTTIGGHNFVGGTLWFEEQDLSSTLKYRMNDFSLIGECDPKAYRIHEATVKYFKQNIQKGDIVVTHHLPSHKSVPVRFSNDIINIFYASKLDSMMVGKEPGVWIHGHTHDSFDYMVANTRVLCNPYGYREREENKRFNKELVLDMDTE